MKVLIVDDEPIVRRSLKRVAESKDHEVFEAEDGLKGLSIWKKVKPDLVFLDVLMPGLTGPQVLEKIGDKKNVKVVLISAYSGEYNLHTAQQLGADLFFEKPFDDIFDVFDKSTALIGN